MHGLNLWEARPRDEAFRAPSRRDSPRVAAPTEKHATRTTQRHARAQFGRPALGAKLWAPSWPHSPRVAAPTEKHATGIDRRHARTAFVGAPPSGRSFGRRAGAIRRGSRLPQKARAPCRAALCTDRICRSPALGAKLFGHRAGAVRRGSRLPQKSARPARRSAMHGLNLWEARPRGEALGTELAPFAAGRASHKKKRAACIRRPPTKKNRSARQCGGYCDSTSVTAWRNTPVRSCGLPGSSRSIRSELPRQTSLPSFAS